MPIKPGEMDSGGNVLRTGLFCDMMLCDWGRFVNGLFCVIYVRDILYLGRFLIGCYVTGSFCD